jgi:ATP-dependent Clp protease ATP-binding subunit ClpB
MNLERLSDRARTALKAATDFARRRNHGRVEPEHLLLAMIVDSNGVVGPLLNQLGADPRLIEHRLNNELKLPHRVGGRRDPTLSPPLQDIISSSEREASRRHTDQVKTEHLLIAIADGPPSDALRILKGAGVTREGIRQLLRQLHGNRTRGNGKGASARAATARPTAKRKAKKRSAEQKQTTTAVLGAIDAPTLIEFGTDLLAEARAGKLDPVIGRDAEIRRLLQVLARRSKNNPCLIGEPGVGKTAVVEALAQRLAVGDVPSSIRGKHIYSLEMGTLVAGTSLRGQFEQRLKKIIDEITAANDRIILFVDELHTLVGSGSDSSMDAANMLKPALARGELRMIGTTTPDEYRQYIEKDAALERRFQKILIDEPDYEACLAILRGIKQRYEIHHGVRISDAALSEAIRLSTRYVSGRALPDKAIDLIDEAASRLRLEIDSMPVDIDQGQRRISNLEAEKKALEQETTKTAATARALIDQQILELRATVADRRARWEAEKAGLDELTALKKELEATQKLVDEAQREGDTGRVAELKYGVVDKINKKIEERTQKNAAITKGTRLVRDVVGEGDIAAIVAGWTGIPVAKMMEGERERLLRMEETLGQRVCGQEEAIASVSAAVKRARAGLKDPNRPIGNFFFVGPTGVGKTELAKALADFLFDTEKAMVRIDMSEYMEQSKVNTLIGSPLGYVGSEKGGVLTEPVRLRPYSVVLFDEAEKAHPEVFNILLQVLDEGRLTDSQGREVDFTNTLVIMTSNVGSRQILDMTGKVSDEELDEAIHGILRERFKPEFLNRLDDIVIFHALSKKTLRLIVEIMLKKVQNLLTEQGMQMNVSDEAKDFLTDVGYQPEYGARPLKRAILNHIQDPLAVELLERRFVEGDTIEVDVHKDGGLTFRKGTGET